MTLTLLLPSGAQLSVPALGTDGLAMAAIKAQVRRELPQAQRCGVHLIVGSDLHRTSLLPADVTTATVVLSGPCSPRPALRRRGFTGDMDRSWADESSSDESEAGCFDWNHPEAPVRGVPPTAAAPRAQLTFGEHDLPPDYREALFRACPKYTALEVVQAYRGDDCDFPGYDEWSMARALEEDFWAEDELGDDRQLAAASGQWPAASTGATRPSGASTETPSASSTS